MHTLREYLREQAEELKSHAADREAMREEWTTAVDRLLTRMEQWLREADIENVLRIERHRVFRREMALGDYEAWGLDVSLNVREVHVVPIARSVLGPIGHRGDPARRAQGLVRLENKEEKIPIYRFLDPSGVESWVMDDDHRYRMRSLDQAAFEDAILRLLE